MQQLTPHRRYELTLLLSAAVIYVTRRLIFEISYINDAVDSCIRDGVPSYVVGRNLAGYDHTLNNNVPLIGGMLFFLVALYLLHEEVFPRLQSRTSPQQVPDRETLTLAGIALISLFISAFVYHYFKLHVRFREDIQGHLIGLKVESFYRKRTIVTDTFALLIIIYAYELLFQGYLFIRRTMAPAFARPFKVMSFLLISGFCLFLFTFALSAYVPQTLWHEPFRSILIVCGSGILVYLLQAYLFHFVLPYVQHPDTTAFLVRVAIFLFGGLSGALLIYWAGSTPFSNRRMFPGVLAPHLFFSLMAPALIAYLRMTFGREKTQLKTEVTSKSAELASLRAQINPHFLFNALNSLYATALKENSEKTADGIQKLGDMMRFMLQENNHERIPLQKEIEYLHNYVDIQRLRLDDSHGFDLRVHLQEPGRDIYLAPMLLTPFVENAFKHGVSLRNPSWIFITLTLDATRLYFKVHNSRHPKLANDPESHNTGVGLDNVRKRLDLIYPNRYTLDIQQSEQDFFVSLTLVYW
nr:histidine kinase [uncultured Arsenicibacter sp.]